MKKRAQVGYQPSRSQQLFLRTLIPVNHINEIVTVHHVLVDTPTKLVLQIERRNPDLSDTFSQCTFERVTI